jgi:hypothetical protein
MLLAAWNQAVMKRGSNQWILTNGYFTSGTKVEFANFLDRALMVTGVNPNKSFDGAEWTTTHMVGSPMAYHIKVLNTRVYLFDIKIAGVRYRSRCWFSDFPRNNTITWGLETGSDLAQTADSKVITSSTALFKSRNIKVGNPFFITSGANVGEYTVQSVDGEGQITLTEELSSVATGSSFWVGGNWFDVRTDDGDVGMGMGTASGELLLYKKNSTHRYNDQGQTLTRVKNMPGTTSSRSIVEGSDGYCYSYHQSGIWRTKGAVGEEISDAMIDVIEGVTTANQDDVVGWEVGKRKIKMFLGDVTLRDGDTVTKCVAVFNHQTNQFETNSFGITPTCATVWLHSNVEEVYVGDDSDSVYQLETGTSFNESAIPLRTILHPIFPAGSENLVDFTRLRLYIENGLEVAVMYKLLYKPMQFKEHHWDIDQTWKSLRGSQRGDRSEWFFPEGTRASGVKLQIIESSAGESLLYEKGVLYYANASDR